MPQFTIPLLSSLQMKCGILHVTYEHENITGIAYALAEFLEPEPLNKTMFLAEPFAPVLAHIEAAMHSHISYLTESHDQSTLS